MAFYDALHRLEEAGELKVDNQHWVKLLSRGRGRGGHPWVSLSEKFGFARPKNGTERTSRRRAGAPERGLPGDQVILTGLQIRDKGPSGRVKRVVARAQNTMTGTVHQRERTAISSPPTALCGLTWRCRKSDLHGAKDGDKVLFEARPERPGGTGTGPWVKSVFGSGGRGPG